MTASLQPYFSVYSIMICCQLARLFQVPTGPHIVASCLEEFGFFGTHVSYTIPYPEMPHTLEDIHKKIPN